MLCQAGFYKMCKQCVQIYTCSWSCIMHVSHCHLQAAVFPKKEDAWKAYLGAIIQYGIFFTPAAVMFGASRASDAPIRI